MFARTERLTLRPGWTEDAPALLAAIGHEAVVRNLSRAPWPYTLTDAEGSIERGHATPGPSFLIFAHEGGRCALIGGIGIGPFRDHAHHLGYWLTPAAWGRGYAVEAARALLDLARTLGVRQVAAGHFIDNPASGNVLRKLGFTATGEVLSVFSAGRNATVDSVEYAIDLSAGRGATRIAA
ncbi:GNAT family N-acetyltransferase [Sphingomonas hankookensis]|uniref:GNAT family N-acetyltransferase n=1 Tax=Sphingomonas hankookensis TaxID=563996 RepID=UPI0026C486C6